MFGVMTQAAPAAWTGMYKDYEELIADLQKRMAESGYKVVKARSHRSRVNGAELPSNEMIRVDLVCDRGGRPYQCHATKHKTTTKKTGCPWKAKAVNRKTLGGWVLTITCEQHNHEPGTPAPPSPSVGEDDADGEVDAPEVGDSAIFARVREPAVTTNGSEVVPQPDPETAAAMAVAGVSREVLRLTGDTFHQFKQEYRKMSKPERMGILSQMQLRIAAIYAVENEDMQRQQRQEAQNRRHAEIEENRRRTVDEQNRTRLAAIASGQVLAPNRPGGVSVSTHSGAATAVGIASQHDTTGTQTVMDPDSVTDPQLTPLQQYQVEQSQTGVLQSQPQQPAAPQLQHMTFPRAQQTPVPVPQIPDFQQYSLSMTNNNGVLHPAKRMRGHRPGNT